MTEQTTVRNSGVATGGVWRSQRWLAPMVLLFTFVLAMSGTGALNAEAGIGWCRRCSPVEIQNIDQNATPEFGSMVEMPNLVVEFAAVRDFNRAHPFVPVHTFEMGAPVSNSDSLSSTDITNGIGWCRRC